jgi:hypothetical protein
MARWNQNRARGLEEEGDSVANATVGCKWGMAAQRLFIPLTVSFHLPEIFGIRISKMWHDPPDFHFFPVTAPANAPLISSAGGPTLACYVW